MLYAGVDCHKRYSQVHVVDEQGRPCAYVPGSATRRLREVVRQRVFLVRMRTMVKNRIQART